MIPDKFYLKISRELFMRISVKKVEEKHFHFQGYLVNNFIILSVVVLKLILKNHSHLKL